MKKARCISTGLFSHLIKNPAQGRVFLSVKPLSSSVPEPDEYAGGGGGRWVRGKHEEPRHFFEEAAKLDPENRALLRAREKFNP